MSQAFHPPVLLALLTAVAAAAPPLSAQGPGSFHFEGCPEWFAQWNGSTPQGTSNTPAMAVLDFDGDGDRDYAYLHPEPTISTQEIRFWENQGGDLVFHSSYQDPGWFLVDIESGDFDGDGRADLAVTGFPKGGSDGRVRILLGDGTGGYQALPDVDLPHSFADISVSDVDLDGRDDAVFASYHDDYVAVLRGNGQYEEFPILEGPIHFDLADLNGDSYPDLVHTRLANPQAFIEIRYNDGSGALNSVPQILGPFETVFATRGGDIDGDGDNDLVLAESIADPSRDEMTLTVLLNDGTGAFSTPVRSQMSETFWPTNDMLICDLDDDLHPDVVFCAAKANFGMLGVVVTARGTGDGRFERLDTLPLVVYGLSLERGAGNRRELWTSRGRIIPIEGAGQMGGHELTRVRPVGSRYLLQGEAVDLDRDSIDDFVYCDPGTGVGSNLGAVEVHYGDGEGSFRDSFVVSLNQPILCQGVRRANLDGDGWPDLVVVGTDRVITLRNDGSGGLFPPVTTMMSPCTLNFCANFASVVGDLNADGLDDLVLNDKRARNAIVALGDGSGGFTPIHILLPEISRNLALEDFDGNGTLDLASIGIETGPQKLFVLPGLGDGTFGPAQATFVNDTTMAYLTAGDVDRDGDEDLVIACYPSGFLVLENDGSGNWTHGDQIHETIGVQELRIEDMNGDGWPELIGLSRMLEKHLIVYENQRGHFLSHAKQIWELTDNHYVEPSQHSSPMTIFLGDFDGDRLKDLGVTTVQIDPAVFQATVYFNRSNLFAIGIAEGGGEVELTLHAPGAANQPYFLLASTRGTWPGIDLSTAFLPLNYDARLWDAIWNGGHGVFVDFMGVLDSEGDAQARFVIPPSFSIPSGIRIDFAFVTADGATHSGRRTSNSVPVRFH